MAAYTHEYSDFPNTVYTVHNFLDLKDAPDAVVEVVTEIKQMMLQKKFSEAAAKLALYQNVLSQYMVDARYINALEEELRNLEIFAKSRKQSLYYSSTEPDGVTGDVWIG